MDAAAATALSCALTNFICCSNPSCSSKGRPLPAASHSRATCNSLSAAGLGVCSCLFCRLQQLFLRHYACHEPVRQSGVCIHFVASDDQCLHTALSPRPTQPLVPPHSVCPSTSKLKEERTDNSAQALLEPIHIRMHDALPLQYKLANPRPKA